MRLANRPGLVPYVACGRFTPIFRKFKIPKLRAVITYRLVKERITDSTAQKMFFLLVASRISISEEGFSVK